ncbi:glutathione S-transferase T3-like [Apium graveolens]|uniref:glutathione S-transferase T3-like n=1 Tax=Apium graveolens TaxID=4045 RepID=UPI003D793FFB
MAQKEQRRIRGYLRAVAMQAACLPAFNNAKFIDLNDDYEEIEDIIENIGQWKWVEDKLLISACLNVSIDPLVGTDQKADGFWEQIQQYCVEENPGVIKRGVVAIIKKWQRINEGAHKYEKCFKKAQKQVGSGSNLSNIIGAAHSLHTTTYKKKSNFEPHYFQLQGQPKWRTPSTTESSKRTKLSSSGAYSSSVNNDTPTSENVVEYSVHPMEVKTAKMKGKGNHY